MLLEQIMIAYTKAKYQLLTSDLTTVEIQIEINIPGSFIFLISESCDTAKVMAAKILFCCALAEQKRL